MYCINCGRKLEDEANFCPACGTKRAEMAVSQNPAAQEAHSKQPVYAVEQKSAERKSKNGRNKLPLKFIAAAAAVLALAIVLIFALGSRGKDPDYSYHFTGFTSYLQQAGGEAYEKLGVPYYHDLSLAPGHSYHEYVMYNVDMPYVKALVEEYIETSLQAEGFVLSKTTADDAVTFRYILKYRGAGLEKIDFGEKPYGHLTLSIGPSEAKDGERGHIWLSCLFVDGLNIEEAKPSYSFTGLEKFTCSGSQFGFLWVSGENPADGAFRKYVINADSFQSAKSKVEDYIYECLSREGFHVNRMFEGYASNAFCALLLYNHDAQLSHITSQRNIVTGKIDNKAWMQCDLELYCIYKEGEGVVEVELRYAPELNIEDVYSSPTQYSGGEYDGSFTEMNSFFESFSGETKFFDYEELRIDSFEDFPSEAKQLSYYIHMDSDLKTAEKLSAEAKIYVDECLKKEGFMLVEAEPNITEGITYGLSYLGEGLTPLYKTSGGDDVHLELGCLRRIDDEKIAVQITYSPELNIKEAQPESASMSGSSGSSSGHVSILQKLVDEAFAQASPSPTPNPDRVTLQDLIDKYGLNETEQVSGATESSTQSYSSSCSSCGGSGDCWSCSGKGGKNKWTGDSYVWQDCAFCSGGSCPYC